MKLSKHQRTELLETIAHICVGLSIFMKGIDKLEHHGKELVGIFFLVCGMAILAGSIYHKKYEQKFGALKYLIYATESLVMAVLGYVYMTDGSKLIHYFCFGVSVLFILPIIVLHRRNKSKKESVSAELPEAYMGEVNSIASKEEII